MNPKDLVSALDILDWADDACGEFGARRNPGAFLPEFRMTDAQAAETAAYLAEAVRLRLIVEGYGQDAGDISGFALSLLSEMKGEGK